MVTESNAKLPMDVPSLEAALCDLSDPVLLIDRDGTIVWCNQAARLLLQLPDGNDFKLISDYLEHPGLETIQAIEHFGQLSFRIPGTRGSTILQTGMVVAIGPHDPDRDQYLLILKSCSLDRSLAAEKEEVLAAVTHDLKNPLGAIFGYADALLDTAVGAELNEKARDVLKRIRGAAARSIDMVKNYEHLFRIESGEAPTPDTSIDLSAAVTMAVETTFREENERPALRMILHTSPLPIRAERTQLNRIFVNLISNALKYSPSEASITVKTTRTKKGQPQCSIHNTGSFIPPNEQDLIFQKYHRGSSAGSRSGTGLGLFIVRSIVSELGGTIRVESSEAEGTTFIVEFPEAS